jgi:hypothetical protein
MPNNGIVTKRTNIPAEFRADSINEFNNATDMVVLNKNIDGFNVEQKSVTLNQLAGLVGGGEAGPQGPMGPQGPAGPAVPSGLHWQGLYDAETGYNLNDVVTWTNPDTDVLGSYWATGSYIYGVNPTDNSGNLNEGWAFLASQGAQGIQGIQGLQGEVGPQGPAGTATLPYKEFTGRFVGTPTSVNLFVGYSSLSGVTIPTRIGVGYYRFTFSNGTDYNGDIAKFIFDWRPNTNVNLYSFIAASSGTNTIDLRIYKYNDLSNAWVLEDPNFDQATLYYRKYN